MGGDGTSSGTGAGDARFLGSVPDVYERLLVPMIFTEPAARLAAAVARAEPRSVLETAAGTGALTRALVRACPGASVLATDLNQPMLEQAAARSTPDADARVTWQRADALELPFEDERFDVVVCQFGVMFFPDKVTGHREARRVLRPGGSLLFNVWDRIETNEVPYVLAEALARAAPADPIDFVARTPHGYFAEDRIRADLEDAGLQVADIDAVDGTSRTTAAEAAVAFCQGTPLRGEIERHPTWDVEQATRVAEEGLVQHFGDGPIEAPIRWFEVHAHKVG